MFMWYLIYCGYLLWCFFLNQYMLYNYEGRGDSMLKGDSPCLQKLENAVPGGFQVGMRLKDRARQSGISLHLS